MDFDLGTSDLDMLVTTLEKFVLCTVVAHLGFKSFSLCLWLSGAGLNNLALSIFLYHSVLGTLQLVHLAAFVSPMYRVPAVSISHCTPFS